MPHRREGFDEFGGEHPVGALLNRPEPGKIANWCRVRRGIRGGRGCVPESFAFFLTPTCEQAGEQALWMSTSWAEALMSPTAAGVNVGGASPFRVAGRRGPAIRGMRR